MRAAVQQRADSAPTESTSDEVSFPVTRNLSGLRFIGHLPDGTHVLDTPLAIFATIRRLRKNSAKKMPRGLYLVKTA